MHRVNGPHVDEPARANVVLRAVEATAKLAGLNLEPLSSGGWSNAQVLIQNSVTAELTPQHAGDVIDPNRPAIVILSELLSPPTRPPAPLPEDLP